MTIKIKAWEDSREVVISVNDLGQLGKKARRTVIEVGDIVNNTVTLAFEPLTLEERVIYKGLEMTAGLDYDYTISGQDVIFNGGVLGLRGHVTINYYSL